MLFLVLTVLFIIPAVLVTAVDEKEEVPGGIIKYYSDNDESELDLLADKIVKGTGLQLEPLWLSSGEAWARGWRRRLPI